MQSAAFPDKSLDSVTHNAVPDFFADGYPDSVLALPVWNVVQDQVSVGGGPAGLITVFEVFVLF